MDISMWDFLAGLDSRKANSTYFFIFFQTRLANM